MQTDHEPDGAPDAGKEMREEYDFSQLKRIDRDVFIARLERKSCERVLNAEMSKEFPDDESVNKALLEYLKMKNETV